MKADASFNLMDRAWIPVTLTNGGHRDLSIREVLEMADDIMAIDGDIPLQRFTLTRLLLAIMYGAFNRRFTDGQGRERTLDASLWLFLLKEGAQGRFARKVLDDYCGRFQDRFDLFDPVNPFYQVAGLHTAKKDVSGLEKLILDAPSGDPFFTTRIGEGLKSLDAAEAARWLVTAQAFDPSGIKSGAVGDPRVKNGKGYPIGTAWCGNLGGFLVEGSTLWQTLMLNFVGKAVLSGPYSAVSWNDDKPIWERPQRDEKTADDFDQPADVVGGTMFFHGPVTLLTWQSRRIRLAHDGETVTGVVIANGDRLKPQNAYCFEMLSGWRLSDPQSKKLHRIVYMPRKHDPTRAIWRGLPTLITGDFTSKDVKDSKPAEYLRPFVLDWLSDMGVSSRPVRLHAFGVEYGAQEAVVDSVVDDALDVNLVVLTKRDKEMRDVIEEAVSSTDQGVGAFRYFAGLVAQAQGIEPDGPRQKAGELAYGAFDAVFRQWLRGIDEESDKSRLRQEWRDRAWSLLRRIERRYMEGVSPRAMVGRLLPQSGTSQEQSAPRPMSVAVADAWFQARLRKIFNPSARPEDATQTTRKGE